MFPDIARDDIFRLETARLWLRWPRASDAAAVHRYGSKWEVARYTARIPHPYPDGSAERFIFAAREGNSAGKDLTLMLTPTRGKRDIFGAISLAGRGVDRLTLAYALAPEAWGKGFASEAAAAMLDAAFSMTRAIEVNASARVENSASRRVLEKVGLRRVGSGLEGAPARGGMVECDRFQISRAEWSARRERLLPPRATAPNELRHEVP